jgi:DNA-binding NarL/FixJ family response regulator
VNVITIALVDDHRVVARSLQAYLESFADLKVVGVAATGEELLEKLDVWNPQVVLQDLLLPGGIDGITTTRRTVQRAPGVRVIALTASLDEARMMGVLRAGAVGYVRKDADPETLLAAVRAVVRGKTYIDPTIGRQIRGSATTTDELSRPRSHEQGHRGRPLGQRRDRQDARRPPAGEAPRRKPRAGDRPGAEARPGGFGLKSRDSGLGTRGSGGPGTRESTSRSGSGIDQGLGSGSGSGS